MERIGTFVGWIVALAIIALGSWAFIKGVDKDPAVVGTVFTALAGIIVVVYQRSREKNQELERSHRDQMAPIYDQLVEMAKDIDEFVKRPQREQEAFFKELSTKLLLHGPPSVIRTWLGWLQLLGVTPLSVPLRAQEKLLLAIREDLGLNNSGLKPGDLIKLYLNEEDTDESRVLWKELRSS
jgi:hypothetical protein